MLSYDKNLNFIYKKPKKYNIIIWVYIFFTILLLISFITTKLYSKTTFKGVYLDNKIVVVSKLEDINFIEKSDFFKIDNKKYSFEIVEYSEIYNNGEINLQDIIIDSNIHNKKNNQIFEITFYYNYESLIKKILKGVLK